MFVQIFLVSVLLSTLVFGTPFMSPVSPAEYQKIIGQGFSTNWFKTKTPLSKYKSKNIEDVYAMGFRNLRLRCDTETGQYQPPYESEEFHSFLEDLKTVVEKCLQVGVAPIISWINHDAEANATEDEHESYLIWWTAVARHLKDKDYRLSFNLFTELDVDRCGDNCKQSLRENTEKYNRWTRDVVHAIRKTGGNNANRILILASPKKTAKGLDLIDRNIYVNDKFMMAEWHLYASGPNKDKGSNKYWKGNGRPNGRENVKKAFKFATDFTRRTNLLTYFGAWMPATNKKEKENKLDESEVINFAKYFVTKCKKEAIPWSLNVLDRYYNTKDSIWISGKQNVAGVKINMANVLREIIKFM